jgi:hypothetical protein
VCSEQLVEELSVAFPASAFCISAGVQVVHHEPSDNCRNDRSGSYLDSEVHVYIVASKATPPALDAPQSTVGFTVAFQGDALKAA